MAGVDKSSPYRAALMQLINAIHQVIPMEESNQVLIVISLDTDEKIRNFFEWLRPKVQGENNLLTTEIEIVRAAVKIGKGLSVEQ